MAYKRWFRDQTPFTNTYTDPITSVSQRLWPLAHFSSLHRRWGQKKNVFEISSFSVDNSDRLQLVCVGGHAVSDTRWFIHFVNGVARRFCRAMVRVLCVNLLKLWKYSPILDCAPLTGTYIACTHNEIVNGMPNKQRKRGGTLTSNEAVGLWTNSRTWITDSAAYARIKIAINKCDIRTKRIESFVWAVGHRKVCHYHNKGDAFARCEWFENYQTLKRKEKSISLKSAAHFRWSGFSIGINWMEDAVIVLSA